MKIVIINGSARKGNTLTAIHAFMKGAAEKNEIEIIAPDKLKIAPCKGCGVCQCYKGCVDQDDTNPTINKIAAADMILFTTPVYWWGMSAQMKQIIDKCYCRGMQLKEYLSWDVLFQKSYYANGKDELVKNVEAMEELENIGKEIL